MIKRILQLLIILFVFQACESNPLDVDISNQKVKLNLFRLDKDLFEAKSVKEINAINKKMLNETGELYEFYTIEMLGAGSPSDDSIAVYLNQLVKDSIMQIVYSNIKTKFGDFSKEKNEIENMFKHLKYHIPHAMIPENIVTYNSTFMSGVVSAPSQIGIGLEMYLGADNEIIKQVPIHEYIKPKMDAQFLMPDIAESWLVNNVIEDQKGEDFLSNMLYYGKIMYVIDAMMPDIEDNRKISYTKEEYNWAKASEYNIWEHIVEQKWIYSKSMKIVVRYFNHGPTTVGLEGSPSRIGQYLGWQVVRAYMEKNPKVTILELIAEKNNSKILKAYKPKKQ